MSIRKTADSIKKCPCLGQYKAKELLAVAHGASGRAQELETRGPIPAATGEVGRPERLQVDLKADASEAFDQSRRKTTDRGSGARANPNIEEEGTNVKTIRMVKEGDTPSFLNDKADGQGEENRVGGGGGRLVVLLERWRSLERQDYQNP